ALAVPIGLLLRRRRRPAARRERGPGRTQLVVLGAAALLSAAVVGVVADPVSWISTNESSEGANSRFNYTGGLNRTDFWAVSANQFSDAPLIGGGSGSFRTRYAVERESPELPRDAHSLGFETLGELGAIGVVLLVIVGGALAAAVFKSRRLGPDEATLAAAALAVGAAWAAQASVDWLTSFPGLTAPVLVLLGAAAGPAALRSGRDAGRRTRVVLGTVLAAAAVAALPLFASDRLTFNAAERWTADPEAAFDALDRAADLNPFADAPFLVAAEIAKQTGDTERGLDALASARDRQQDEWLSYLIEAEILADTDPEAALEALMRARELNPLDEDIAELEKELRAPRRSG
ncbi:MAG: O-antigen ligase family protein, partial [Solirubrobacterales bacterium]